MIAALYVQTNGVYYGLPDVDPWDEARDARLYDGPWPVVAHPPCSRWCHTPLAFRDLLLSIANTVHPPATPHAPAPRGEGSPADSLPRPTLPVSGSPSSWPGSPSSWLGAVGRGFSQDGGDR